MRTARLVVLLLLSLGLLATAAPASAAPTLATLQFTAGTAVDSRTVTLSWTAVKRADHYVVEYAPAQSVRTSATSVTVTGLYPGEEHVFTVRAETRRNAPSATSAPIVVATPPEGPSSPSATPWSDDTIRIWWSSGIGCATYELATVQVDGSIGALVTPVAILDPTTWLVSQEPESTVTYAVRCRSAAGLASPWSPPSVVAL